MAIASEKTPPSLPLSQAPLGGTFRIEKILHRGNTLTRLMEMGVAPGEKIRRIRFAPLGSPVQYEILGYHLLLRDQEASRIFVTQALI